MNNIYYKFISSKVEMSNDEDNVELRLLRVIEPPIMDYVKSFFGLFAPIPQVKQNEVVFINDRYGWFEKNLSIYCQEEMSELLDKFLTLYYNEPSSIERYVGIP